MSRERDVARLGVIDPLHGKGKGLMDVVRARLKIIIGAITGLTISISNSALESSSRLVYKPMFPSSVI
jgi:hypothetical protein